MSVAMREPLKFGFLGECKASLAFRSSRRDVVAPHERLPVV